jgi:hypothetical protein
LWEQKRLPRERSWTVSGPKDSGQVHQSAKTAPHGIIHLLLNLTCLTGFGLTAVAFVVSGTAGLTCRIAHLSLFYRRLLKAEFREFSYGSIADFCEQSTETHKLCLELFL